MWDHIKEEFGHAVYALLVVVSHVLLAAASITGVKLIELIIHAYWPDGEPFLFRGVSLRTVVDWTDAIILIVFVGMSVVRIGQVTLGKTK